MTQAARAFGTSPRALGAIGTVLLVLGGLLVGVPSTRDPLLQDALFRHLRGFLAPAVALLFVGVSLLVLAWWRLRRTLATTDLRSLIVTLLVWSAPLLVSVPLFSRDAYSYLAQGRMTALGIDAYQYGPAALGGPLDLDIPQIWQYTPAPYGPVFLGIAADVMNITGEHSYLGILLMRILAWAGMALVVLGVIRIARAVGVDERQALWLGVLNPLTILHLLGDSHNDALMLGLMLTGLALALERHPVPGVAVVTLGALVKAPAALAIIFLVPIWMAQLSGRARFLRAAGATGAISLATAVVTTAIAGTGYGWIAALDTPTKAHTWTSVTTDLGFWTGLLTEKLGIASGEATLTVWRTAGLLGAGLLCLEFFRRYYRTTPVTGLGLGMGAVVIFGPVLHPWYLLWAIIPLAAAAGSPRLRAWVQGVSIAMILTVLPGGVQPVPAVYLGAVCGLLLVFGVAWARATGLRRDEMLASVRSLFQRRAPGGGTQPLREMEQRETVAVDP